MTDLSRATEIAQEKWENPAERKHFTELSDWPSSKTEQEVDDGD